VGVLEVVPPEERSPLDRSEALEHPTAPKPAQSIEPIIAQDQGRIVTLLFELTFFICTPR
jgi:hypothetical protein